MVATVPKKRVSDRFSYCVLHCRLELDWSPQSATSSSSSSSQRLVFTSSFTHASVKSVENVSKHDGGHVSPGCKLPEETRVPCRRRCLEHLIFSRSLFCFFFFLSTFLGWRGWNVWNLVVCTVKVYIFFFDFLFLPKLSLKVWFDFRFS